MEDRDVDVAIVGSGAAGLAAALSAREHGAERVLVAEAEERPGGSSRLSGGLIMGAGTRFQRAAGISDDAESLFRDYMTLNRWDVEPALVRRLAEEAGPAIEWLADLGVQFHENLMFGADESVPRVHVPKGAGEHVVEVLQGACSRAGIDIAVGRRVDRLLVDDDAVKGFAVGDDEITADAVVLASGGFANAPEMLVRYFPSAARTDWHWYIGAEGARGDAFHLAEQVDARILGHDRGLRLLHADFARIYEAFLPGWLLLVDHQGHRFMDETAPYGIIDSLVRDRGDVAWAVFDHAALEATLVHGPRYKQVVPGSRPRPSPHWNVEVIEQMVADGKVQRHGDVPSLARALGLPADALQGTIDRYNGHVAVGEDRDYLKAVKFLEPVAHPPFYGAQLRPATVCLTGCGPRIDRDARLLDRNDQPVPGLYAAGECTGGVIGPAYVGSGNSYANCLVFGRMAGQHAAAQRTASV